MAGDASASVGVGPPLAREDCWSTRGLALGIAFVIRRGGGEEMEDVGDARAQRRGLVARQRTGERLVELQQFLLQDEEEFEAVEIEAELLDCADQVAQALDILGRIEA